MHQPRKDRKTCYYCKKPGHFRRDCHKLKRKLEHDAKQGNRPSKGEAASPVKNIKTSASIGSIHKETGIFVDALVAGTKIRFLVDTGAFLSLLSSAKTGDIPLTSAPQTRRRSAKSLGCRRKQTQHHRQRFLQRFFGKYTDRPGVCCCRYFC